MASKKSTLVPETYTSTYKCVGYFPTLNLIRMLPLFENNKVARIFGVKAFRGQLIHKAAWEPLPFVKVSDLANKDVKVDYNFVRHGELDVKALKYTTVGAGADLLVIDELCVAIPCEAIFPERAEDAGWKGRSFIAIFNGYYEREPDGDYKKVLREKISKEEIERGLKYSSLDIVALQDAKTWMKGSRKGYFKEYKEGIREDSPLIRRVLAAINPDKEFGRLRIYKKGKRGAWILHSDERI